LASNLKILFKYVKWYLKANTIHDLHSPFAFDFAVNVIRSKNKFYVFDEIEFIRHQLLSDDTLLEVTDLGAGSKINKYNKRKIKDIARASLNSANYLQMLFRLVNYLKPKEIIELGTSLGVSTLYFASENTQRRIYTMEGCPNIASIAERNAHLLKLNNIQIIKGDFDENLPLVFQKIKNPDFVFIDGNHRKEATLRYFELCRQKLTGDAVFVLDDIYWSDEMEAAWKEIKNHPQVDISIDLFKMGIIFFKKGVTRGHYSLRLP
jgi:predicted O-methyltransferase YrrM